MCKLLEVAEFSLCMDLIAVTKFVRFAANFYLTFMKFTAFLGGCQISKLYILLYKSYNVISLLFTCLAS